MNTKQNETIGIDELLNNGVSADVLTELLPDRTSTQWGLWLQNNRNQSRRVPYRIPFEKMAGGVFYRREELAKFAEWEKSRQLGSIKLTGRAAEVVRAFGIGTASGSSTGRQLKVTGVALQVDQATKQPYVQLITNDPLMVYRLELDTAKALGSDLSATAAAGARIANRTNDNKLDDSKYETVTENATMIVQRLKK